MTIVKLKRKMLFSQCRRRLSLLLVDVSVRGLWLRSPSEEAFETSLYGPGSISSFKSSIINNVARCLPATS